MSQIASDAKISSAMAALGMTAPLPNLDDSQVLKAILVALGNITSGGGGGGTGDVVGPASSTAGNAAVFASGTGKLLADSGIALTAAAVGFTIAGGTTSKTLTVLNTGTAALLEVANNFTIAGAANSPAMVLSGAIFAGGTGTSTKPLFLIEPAGATANTNWNTNGTTIGVNAGAGFSGDLLRLAINGTNWLKYNASGKLTIHETAGNYISTSSFGFLELGSNNGPTVGVWGGNGLVLPYSVSLIWTNGNLNGTRDSGIKRVSASALKVTDGSTGYGSVDAGGYSASGSVGVTAGPFTVITSIQVKNGIVIGLTGT